MKKTMMMAVALAFLAGTVGVASAQRTPKQEDSKESKKKKAPEKQKYETKEKKKQ